MKRNVIIATLAASGVIAGGVVAGTALADDDSRDSTPRSLRTADAADRQAGDGTREGRDGNERRSASVSAAEAVERALKEVPGTAAGLEREDDDRVWEVDVVAEDGSWRLVEVDRSTGDVVANRAERDSDDFGDDDGDDDRRDAGALRGFLAKAEVSAADAARIAAGEKAGPIEELELNDRGTAWKVELGGKDDDRELRVDAASGKVTVLDDDADDDRRDDDRDDDRDSKDDDSDDDRDDDRRDG
ncbi:PepSY domain-containing protein [Streptomyces sp. 549]|uniref:PepSY domain-containing protein n=1 Tax=Streptomyces sp. 549 TaxID=3049076 RepID=UPI0024C3078F|nr:PepSY domain-containing protein [Streptomyces sp. 549]MDK1474871.1 PepSY domain-containing protein [Streptomyces sp. 549]